MSTAIRYEMADDGILALVLDAPGRPANVMDATFISSFKEVVERVEGEADRIRGIVVSSAKETFFAGGDIDELRSLDPAAAAQFRARVDDFKADMRRLETLGKPVVATVAGSALGGGLELCLIAHHRVVVDDPQIRLGFPEVTLGLLPGGGGIVRSVRMLGVARALGGLLLDGRQITPRKALDIGIVDELVDSVDELYPVARGFIESHPESGQPWDAAGYEIPGGSPTGAAMARVLPALPADLRRRLKGARYPAPRAIMAAAVESAEVDPDNGFTIEGRYFTNVATGQVAKNMMQAFFFDMQAVRGDRDRPAGGGRFEPKKVAVVGAGMMGAGIAYVCAAAGIEVVLIDVSSEAAESGRSRSERIVARDVAKGRISDAAGRAILDRIVATDRASTADGADLVIEAVFEDPAVKAKVLAELEAHVAPHSLLASNTSTLPITSLAENVSRPEDFIGLHFFSPVEKMPLLEIVKGERTSDETLHRALDLAWQIKKTPIVVNDSRGFFTSRVIGAFINEGIAMLAEGIPAATIEQAASQAGYPAPVLQLTDEVNMELMASIRKAGDEALRAEGRSPLPHPAFAVVDAMIEAGRPGRAARAGFYEYAEDGVRTGLWSGLSELFPVTVDPATIDLPGLEERMLFVESLETVRCLDEGVLETVAEANVGSILGIGFPGWSGGVLQYVNGYEGGVAGFVDRSRRLAEKHGERFEPPRSLSDKAAAGTTY
ncbi:MAG TPA: FAD-dependent oxidoreductase [Solirubrobacterales bacterium]|nr:FAD-dependent oxidoreductase [Solirubrobacterales bacterium]